MATSQEATSQQSSNHGNARDHWLEAHGDTAAMLLVLIGFFARLWTASGIFLNPDEALHFRLANQTSWWHAYQQSLTAAHPPLLILLLYFWRALGTSELWLRIPSVIAGTVFCWVFFKWVSSVAGKLAGLLSLILVALLPPVILLSAEIRQYALLLVFLMGALYLMERAFAENSGGLMCAATICLYLGMLTHYSGFLFAGALGVYALLRIFVPAPRPHAWVIAVWAAGQIGALALVAFLYKTHLSKLGAGQSRTVMQGWMSEYYLHNSYFERGRDNPFLFVAGHSFGVFQFIFGQFAIGDLAGLLFLVALAMLLWGKLHSVELRTPRRLGIFFVMCFVMLAGASLAHVYPYGGTRQVALLVIPAAMGVGLGLAWATRWRWTRATVIAMVAVVLCIAFGKPRPPAMNRGDQSTKNVAAALEFMRENAAGQPIFVDYQTDLMLGHYLCGEKPIPFSDAPDRFEEFSCGGHRVICADYKTAWMFSADNFVYEWQQLLQSYGLKPGETVWIFQSGWGINLPVWLQESYAEFRGLPYQQFGRNIKIFKLTVGQPMPPANVPTPTGFTSPAVSGKDSRIP